MRIFGLVFGSLLLVGIVVITFNRSQDFAVVAWESWKLRNQIAGLPAALQKTNNSKCFDEVTNNGMVVGVQLRFDSESSYVIEQVCESSHLEPAILSKHTLSYQVKRIYGSGILVLREEEKIDREGWVILGKNDVQMSVGLKHGNAELQMKADKLAYGGNNAAQASCTEWGFSCCDVKTSQGEGEKINTFDCNANCYQRCNSFPTLVFFNTDPFLNQKTRTLYVEGREPRVEFAYQLVDDQEIKRVLIDFGDGTTSEYTSSKTKEIYHTYSCDQPRCMYEVSLNAWDTSGAQSLPTELSKVKIIVQP